MLVDPSRWSVKAGAQSLQRLLPGAVVKELRQVGRTSEELLAKVQLLVLLVTAVVVICAGSSVAGTMSTTVLERGKEIGLVKAMGGTRWHLLRVFSAEALLLVLAAGVSGYLLGSDIFSPSHSGGGDLKGASRSKGSERNRGTERHLKWLLQS
ncbi:hypothetical protein GEOBRER4_n3560 [Citrifermentans bremense]|uniref:ABC3 transporter permease C-terminal domain-containing protein n=1 Tax=Citrifermentans bremense TaxID=60035 RepID=A0A6S6M9Y2_9BACT|nr:hypothetical protein GEOBRER4_n3560 [Citrifermentans bremense]